MIAHQNGADITFELDEKMYVNPTTLQMSSSRVKNYVETNELFVPVGKEDLLYLDDSYILIKEAGYSAVDIVLPFTFFFGKVLIGFCHESDFCLVGGIRE